MLQDALHEMIMAYHQQNQEIPIGGALLEQMPVRKMLQDALHEMIMAYHQHE